ncbi:hypothetical protein [Nitratireductor pacificus]|nr:hypothetical protein [Nitratireductor pacificus]
MRLISVACSTALALGIGMGAASAFQLNFIGSGSDSHHGVQCNNGTYFEMRQVGVYKQWGVISGSTVNVPDWRKFDSCRGNVRSATHIRSPGQAAATLCACAGSS